MTTDRSLRIREGLNEVQEQTMTFSNIQNVAIRQGPVQRWFGISDLEVRTAGGGGKAEEERHGGTSGNLHIGYFRGVDNAAEIRDLILDHLRRLRSSDVGDPDEQEAPAAANPIEAAQELLAEVRALHKTIQ